MENVLIKMRHLKKNCHSEGEAPTPIKHDIKMFYVYILKSEKDKKLYIGYTNDFQRRIREHNEGKVLSTKPRRPLELIYFEGYKSEKDARQREKNLKLYSNAYYQLLKRIKNSLK